MKKIENKDLTLKYLCKMLYSKMGYSTHYEIRLRTKSYINSFKAHDVSDIDVLGYYFNADLTHITIGAECKSGESNALDELYKFFGISEYFKLDRAYLIKTKLHQNARQVAMHHKCVCLTEAELRQLLLGFDINIDYSLNIESGKYYRSIKYLNSYKEKNEKLIDYLRLDFWNRENWKNIHNIIHLGKPTQTEVFNDIQIIDKYIYYYLAELFALSILKNISEAITLNFSDFENAFVNCLYGGAESLNEKKRIFDTVSIATKENKKFEPEWQVDLQNIASRFAFSTYATSLIPRMIQDVIENCFFDQKVKIDPKIIEKYPENTRKFVQDIMQFLTSACSLDKKIYEDFMLV